MRILFLTDNFPPETNAPASRTYEHCIEWVKKGAEVTVVTCAPNFPTGKVYEGYRNRLYQQSQMDGIRVIRVWSYITPNRGIVKRILDYMSFSVTSFFAALFIKTDLIVATSPQLFTAVSGYFTALLKRKKWVMEVRDLWPDSIQAVEAIEKNTILKILDRLVLFLYRKADQIIVVTDSFKERLIACNIDEAKIKVVKNGVHMHQFPLLPKDQELIRKLGIEDKFVVSYIGTMGMAHGLDFILDCAQEIEDERIHFVLVGEGAMKTRLIAQQQANQIKNVSILDGVPKSEVCAYISITDVALINLRKKNTFTKVIPSKIFENAAMEKPILLGVEGEAAQIIKSYSAGRCFEPENKEDFLENLKVLVNDAIIYESYKAGLRNLAQNFDRKRLALKMLAYLSELQEESRLDSVQVH